jgi:hypothetical protein
MRVSKEFSLNFVTIFEAVRIIFPVRRNFGALRMFGGGLLKRQKACFVWPEVWGLL